jgi:hypothetical protein
MEGSSSTIQNKVPERCIRAKTAEKTAVFLFAIFH